MLNIFAELLLLILLLPPLLGMNNVNKTRSLKINTLTFELLVFIATFADPKK